MFCDEKQAKNFLQNRFLISFSFQTFYMDFVALGYDPEDVKKYVAVGSDRPGPDQETILKARKAFQKNPAYLNQSNLHEVCF